MGAQQGETFVSAYMALAGLSELLPECHHLTDDEPITIQRLTAWAFRGWALPTRRSTSSSAGPPVTGAGDPQAG